MVVLAPASLRIEFVGAIEESALPDLCRSADVFVAPCVRPADGDGDGVPTVVLEAMSCGLVVIASDLLSMGEYVKAALTFTESRGILTRPGDVDDLPAMLRVTLAGDMETSPVLDAYRKNARAFAVERLDIRKNIARIEAVLKGRA